MKARLAIVAGLAGALVLPTAAQAAGTLIGGPLKVRDYEMTLIGTDAAKDSLTVFFSKTAGGSSQQHMYSFDSGVNVTPTSISAGLGSYGAIKMNLVGATSAKGSVPKGCTGKAGTTRRGTLTGSFKLVADKTYFRTVKTKKLDGTAQTGGTIRCDGATGNPGTGSPGGRSTSLMVTEQGPNGMFTFTATKDSQSAMQMDEASKTSPAQIMHMISAKGSGLAVQGRTAADVKGISPFLTGNGAFDGEAAGTMATGTLDGSLTARFDSIGAIAVKGDAMLMGG
jgi:hypothetical protein